MTPKDIEKALQRSAPVVGAVEAPPQKMPAAARSKLDKLLQEKFVKMAEQEGDYALKAKDMRLLLLKMLSERPDDGISLVKRLNEKKVTLEDGGEGEIFGILNRMEDEGLLEGRWREGGARMVKSYHITEKGNKKLERTDAAELFSWWQALAGENG